MERFIDSDSVCVIRECGHIFSTQELQLWFRSNCRCPVCRYDIRNYNPSSNRTQQERNQPEPSVDMSNNIIPAPNIRDVSGNYINNLNGTDVTNLLVNYYTRGTHR